MNLLEDIQNAASDPSSSVSTLLRKCKILAARLGNQRLEDWIVWESDGYPEDVPVPKYRIWSLQVRGNFLGPYSNLNHAPISALKLPQDVRKSYNEYKCRFSIASIESAIKNEDQMVLATGGLASALGRSVYRNMTCVECWAECSIGDCIELLNVVRNRVLDFSLDLWKANPAVGESNSDAQELLSEDGITQSVNQTFNTTVHEGNIMADNTISKLRVSRAEASEKIRSRINIGKELHKTQINSQHEFDKLKSDTEKWTDYNKTLFGTLFDESPLPWWHGTANTYTYDRGLDIEIPYHKRKISQWINELESVYDQLEVYEELPSNTQQTMDRGTMNNENKKIFIGHGRSHIWRALKDFIVEKLKLPYEEFERIPTAGMSISNRLEEMLEGSCMAFIIMTGEDEHADNLLHARENVIHEVGLFQGRLGFKKAIILLEDGCERFSNIEGLIYISFPKGDITAAFEKIRDVLEFHNIKEKSV